MEQQETTAAREEQKDAPAKSSALKDQLKETSVENTADACIEETPDGEAGEAEETTTVSEDASQVADDDLQGTWTFWFSTKPKSAEEKFEDCLHKIGTFNCIADFFKYVFAPPRLGHSR